MYPIDVVPYMLAHAWIAGLALLVGGLLGRVFPRAVPYAVLVASLAASSYFTWMAWLIEGNVWIPLGFLAIAVVLSVLLAYVLRYMKTAFEFALFWAGWNLVLFAGLTTPWATTTVDVILGLLAAFACVAATVPLTRRVLHRAKAPEPVAAAATGRTTTA